MTPPAVHLSAISFRWQRNDAFCLRLPEITVAPGDSLFIHGPSGSGKSTLLNLIGGVALPQEGEVRVLGQALNALSAHQRDRFRADHVGFIFQQFNLIPYLSVIDNVLLACRFSARRAQRAGQAKEDAERLHGELEIDAALFHRPARQLSVGQQQRVAAARALLGRPEIIIADEPTSALDASRQAAFVRLLLEEAKGTGSSVLFVSHDLSLAPYFGQRMALSAAAPDEARP